MKKKQRQEDLRVTQILLSHYLKLVLSQPLFVCWYIISRKKSIESSGHQMKPSFASDGIRLFRSHGTSGIVRKIGWYDSILPRFGQHISRIELLRPQWVKLVASPADNHKAVFHRLLVCSFYRCFHWKNSVVLELFSNLPRFFHI